MFKIKHKKPVTRLQAVGHAAPRIAVRFEEPFRPEEVRMSADSNGKLATNEPMKVIACNVEIPESFVPAFAVNILIDKSGHVVMDADFVQMDLVLHLVTAAMNTTLAAVRMKLRQDEAAKSAIIAPGSFRVERDS